MVGNAKHKRLKHKSEQRWNRFDEPFLQFCNFKKNTTWINRKTLRSERRYNTISLDINT